MANKDIEVGPFLGPSEVPGIDLRGLRRDVLIEGGLLSPRQKYASKEERKTAAKERGKARRESRKAFLESKGIPVVKKQPKLTKAQRKLKSKGLRQVRNIYLREHPEEALRLGINIHRLRV